MRKNFWGGATKNLKQRLVILEILEKMRSHTTNKTMNANTTLRIAERLQQKTTDSLHRN